MDASRGTSDDEKCEHCGGSGRCPTCEDVFPENERCPDCGKYMGTCRRCSGTGKAA